LAFSLKAGEKEWKLQQRQQTVLSYPFRIIHLSKI